MPTLDVSELNVVIAVLGGFMLLYGVISVKIKRFWYLGEALPAVLVGIILGPAAARLLDATEWGSAVKDQQEAITLGLCRVAIGVQLVMAGYQLPAQYQRYHWKEMFICLIPNMTLMWLLTSGCVMASIPDMPFVSALVIGSCVTCTDPILSQSVAKGPFADKYVARELREIISSEAGINDGFGFPFLMLATYIMRHAQGDVGGSHKAQGLSSDHLMARAGDVGRQGGGVGEALGNWVVETWLYYVVLGAVYGVVVGYTALHVLRFTLRRKWIDSESYLLFPTALGLFILGTCGCIGTNDLIACFCAGSALNWDGGFLAETEARHDEVNASIDVLLNFGGFMYIGAIFPWGEFHQPDLTGITYPRLFLLGVMVLLLRRIPSILLLYKLMPRVCKNWKEALFMGYFGPIGGSPSPGMLHNEKRPAELLHLGIGAVFYVEHTRHLFPKPGEGDEVETQLMRVIGPTVYWLVFFSIFIHGLSIPALNAIYTAAGVPPVVDPSGPAEIRPLSANQALPKNSYLNAKRRSIMLFNRFSRANYPGNLGWELPFVHDDRHEQSGAPNPPTFHLQSMGHHI
ncbi:Na(+)/H(+) antiporter 1 [Aspergillus steynii IBT 23096]|uniref:Na(+)/H(+) antiporter 1 n=1 Tax=Aspergillus steynii IBT 23096 TaxID=1392250 RepID=A0A2I2FXF5_9EURO|nr:Na(+)/H(+) antiporter 1 [Aspergillus steynii IBT 23096]PLB45321.1 Na(+)/H(+) antiporter 1 [Aspergillus steynii IBT 23096]